MPKDIEQAIEDVKGKKFGVSINNIIAIVTFLSTAIAGWYSFTPYLKSANGSFNNFSNLEISPLSLSISFCSLIISPS